MAAAAAAPDLKGITVLVNVNSRPPISHWDLLGCNLFFELLQRVPSAVLTTGAQECAAGAEEKAAKIK